MKSGLSFLALVVLTGCYTQLAVYPPAPRGWAGDGVTVADPETDAEAPDTVVHEHYWTDAWLGYEPGFHVGVGFYMGDPFWYPWCYRPPYWSYRCRGWRYGYFPFGHGPFWWDPFWYDPYYAYGVGSYYGAIWYPYWDWYGPYAVFPARDRVPRKKRDWDRRGATERTATVRTRSGEPGAENVGNRKVRPAESRPEATGGVAGYVGRLIKRSVSKREESKPSSTPSVRRSSSSKSRSSRSSPSVTRSRPSVSRSSPGRSGSGSSGRSRSGSSKNSSRSRSGNEN